jgi:type III pantothenate kinase
MRLGILVGNSSIRFATATGSEDSILTSGRLSWEIGAAPPDISPIVQCAAEPGLAEILIASVRQERDSLLYAKLRSRGVAIRRAGKDFPIPIENRYDAPKRAGIDRLLACVAASRSSPGRPSVVLDFGTALTVSFVSGDGAFLGGLIAPGFDAQSRGLALLAPRLPRVSTTTPRGDSLIATNTEGAIIAGIEALIVGGVHRIIDVARQRFPGIRVLATGGGAGVIADRGIEIDGIDLDLGMRGLFFSRSAASASAISSSSTVATPSASGASPDGKP